MKCTNDYVFPHQELTKEHATEQVTRGLTKREYFAAKAMAAYASSKSYDCASYNTIAEYSVRLADAVLKELDNK